MSHTDGGFLSIPASAFTGRLDDGVEGYEGNESGTARFFRVKMFAPVYLPNGVTVTFFQGGGRAFFKRSIVFTLRRNDPQQANVDMAVIKTSLDGTSFEFVSTTDIDSGEVNNGRFNYYIVAEIEDPNVPQNTKAICPEGECWVGFCRIGYT